LLTDFLAKLADENLRVNWDLHIWDIGTTYIQEKKVPTSRRFCRVPRTATGLLANQKILSSLKKENIHKERMSWNLKEQIIPISDSTASPSTLPCF
jgi:hypothetical protein